MPEALISFSWATLARKYPLSDRSVPTMDSATWCRTAPAVRSAARRLRPEVSKNSSTALSSNEGELARSITTCVPVMASLRPWPLMVLTPVLGEAATTSWPLWRRMGAVFDPIRPVPPMTTIFMFRFLSSIGSECSLRHRQPCARLFGRIQNSGSTRETTGRKMELTRFLERHTTIGGVCCRGQELSRILSLPMGERPEAACEGTLKRERLPCQEDASTQNSGYRRTPRGSEVTATQSIDDIRPISLSRRRGRRQGRGQGGQTDSGGRE